MQKRNDETLLAYLDGELDTAERRDVEAWLEADPGLRDRLTAFAQSADLIRVAYTEIVNEALPERLIAAARGETAGAVTAPAAEAKIVALQRPGKAAARRPAFGWGSGIAIAAGLCGLVIGSAGNYFGGALLVPANSGNERQIAAASVSQGWLDNAAAYYKLSVSAGDTLRVDVAAGGDTRDALQKISQSLPQQARLPDLKPWGLNFQGARFVVVEGRPAAQLVYTTDNKAIGPLTLLIGSSKQADIAPAFDRRQDVNLLYWRHQGHAYVLTGQTDIGYLWNIANDVAWQLDAI